MPESYTRLAERALRDELPSEEEARRILDGEGFALLPLLAAAMAPRERHFGRKVMVHVLNNVQNGLCPEDCGYCSQSRDSETAIRKYPMKSDAEILAEAGRAARAGASRYCMVLSGRGPCARAGSIRSEELLDVPIHARTPARTSKTEQEGNTILRLRTLSIKYI